jgi:hypothetical protein
MTVTRTTPKHPKSGEVSHSQELLMETPQQEDARKKAIAKSPRLKDLSEPYITDNGRIWVYFKKGEDPQKKGLIFEELRNGRIGKIGL